MVESIELEAVRGQERERKQEEDELSATVQTSSIHESRAELEAVALEPVDGGLSAWTFVFCSFVLECIVWGLPFSFGVVQDWYLTHPPFDKSSEAAINAIGTVTLAIQYSEGLFLFILARRRPRWVKPIMRISLVTCVVSMLVSSFATEVWQLILLQGVIYGVAGGALYVPVIIWLSEWFVTRRSLAGALIFGGSGLGGAIFPLAMTFLLEKTGFRWTLRVYSGIVAVCGGLATIGVRPRLPIAPVSRSAPVPPLDLKFVRSPLFMAVSFTIFIQGLAYFPVSLYIPSYASALGYSRINGTLALTAFNSASVVGQILFGYYCDRAPYPRVMIFSGFVSCVLALVMWGFAHSLPLIFLFVVFFGSISGGFSSIWTPASAELSNAQPTTPFVFFAIVKGLAAVLGPMVAAALHPKRVASIALAAGPGGWSGYGFTGITIFVGSMMAATTIGSVASTLLR